jgi:hypothetical protein
LPASTIPAAHQRSAIVPSCQRLTLPACSQQIEIIDSMVIFRRAKRWLADQQHCVADGVLDAA